jgi:hypothetical protein
MRLQGLFMTLVCSFYLVKSEEISGLVSLGEDTQDREGLVG